MGEQRYVGAQSICFTEDIYVLGRAAIVGKKEGEGPLRSFFDEIDETDMFEGKNWNDAESRMMQKAAALAIRKAGLTPKQIRMLFAGDLLGQLLASSFGAGELPIPFLGVYGACSTMGESLLLASMAVGGGFADCTEAVTSSHFASAEKEFRFPLGYGNQRPLTATWTVTGSGALVVGNRAALERCRAQREEEKGRCAGALCAGVEVVISGGTIGRVTDFGIKDKANMGACMAPAAAEVVETHLKDFHRMPEYYDKIITGDLGEIGAKIFADILGQKGFQVEPVQEDCGLLIYDNELQDTHSGGSGCGCCAVTLAGYLLDKLYEGEWSRILFVPTGALLSPVSANEGSSIPGIAHAIVLERKGEEK
ncbi:MAG: stage V sporulation protein AD [Lachnospiraceae bacterium]|nr:stage V sporulation protein AD [Lachnospiraceae bacterium]